VLVERAAGLRIARLVEFSIGLGAAVQETVGRSTPLIERPLDCLACFTEVNELAHPLRSIMGPDRTGETGLGFVFAVKCALSVAIFTFPCTAIMKNLIEPYRSIASGVKSEVHVGLNGRQYDTGSLYRCVPCPTIWSGRLTKIEQRHQAS
jgi:hypothetical protein